MGRGLLIPGTEIKATAGAGKNLIWRLQPAENSVRKGQQKNPQKKTVLNELKQEKEQNITLEQDSTSYDCFFCYLLLSNEPLKPKKNDFNHQGEVFLPILTNPDKKNHELLIY